MPQSQEHWIGATSVNYATGYNNAQSLSHYARPGIEQRQRCVLNSLSHIRNASVHFDCILLNKKDFVSLKVQGKFKEVTF